MRDVTLNYLPMRVTSSGFKQENKPFVRRLDALGDEINLDKRKAYLDYILSICKYNIEWHFIQNEIARVIQNMMSTGRKNNYYNSSPEVKFYELHEGYDKYPEAVEYNELNFNPLWNTRDIMIEEGVFEFEGGKDWVENIRAFWIGINDLMKYNVNFTVFFAEGMRTPHIHAYELFADVDDWAVKELTYHLFCQKIFSLEIRHLIDKSLAGKQTIALEYSKHWRSGKIKKVLFTNKDLEGSNATKKYL